MELEPEDAETICQLGIEQRDKIEIDYELFSQLILCLTGILKSAIQSEE